MQFKKGIDPKKAMRIGRTIWDELKEHPICKPMNSIEAGTNNDADLRNPDVMVWINPNNQFSFNANWINASDAEEWMNGTGKMVKGETPEEKKKYWDYAVAEALDPDQVIWMIRYHYKWFDKMTTDFNPHEHKPSYSMETQIKNPIKIKARVKDSVEDRKRQEEVIVKMLAPFTQEFKKDLDMGREWQYIRQEFDREFYGIKRTLYCLGVGYMGACNTPEDICNLSWVDHVVLAKGYYLHIKEKGLKVDGKELTMPDWEWLTNK